jgi:NADH dehydrogenase [ubiquinone] 1 alpha subcomplex assembly factor 7
MFGNTIREIHLVETSEYFKKLQKDKLNEWEQKGIRIHHHQGIQAVGTADSDTFTIIVAHEFFDALPIHMFEKRAEGWREVFVDLEKRPQTSNDERKKVLIPGQPALPQVIGGRTKVEDEVDPKLRFVASPSPTLAANLLVRNSDERFKGLSQGTRIEVCPDMYGIAAIAAKLVQPKGAGLVVDYGGDRFFNHSFRVGYCIHEKYKVGISFPDKRASLQAFKNHKLADPLEEPGSADLTSNVDFSALRDALMSGFTSTEAAFAEAKASSMEDSPKQERKDDLYVPPLLSQRSFLLSLGLQLRVEKLVQNASNDERRKDIITAAHRLVDKNEKIHGMGKVFKVLGFVPAQESEKQEVFPFGKELD